MPPRSWAEVEQHLAYLFGGGEHGSATARQLLEQAVRARWGVESLHELQRWQRQVAFQKLAGACLALADEASLSGDLAFRLHGTRALVVRVFARYFDGAAIDGPPWRLDPSEPLETYGEFVAGADFEDPPIGGQTPVHERVR